MKTDRSRTDIFIFTSQPTCLTPRLLIAFAWCHRSSNLLYTCPFIPVQVSPSYLRTVALAADSSVVRRVEASAGQHPLRRKGGGRPDIEAEIRAQTEKRGKQRVLETFSSRRWSFASWSVFDQ
eukprot:6110033-Pleurochrysis_carterae.AAC.1